MTVKLLASAEVQVLPYVLQNPQALGQPARKLQCCAEIATMLQVAAHTHDLAAPIQHMV